MIKNFWCTIDICELQISATPTANTRWTSVKSSFPKSLNSHEQTARRTKRWLYKNWYTWKCKEESCDITRNKNRKTLLERTTNRETDTVSGPNLRGRGSRKAHPQKREPSIKPFIFNLTFLYRAVASNFVSEGGGVNMGDANKRVAEGNFLKEFLLWNAAFRWTIDYILTTYIIKIFRHSFVGGLNP